MHKPQAKVASASIKPGKKRGGKARSCSVQNNAALHDPAALIKELGQAHHRSSSNRQSTALAVKSVKKSNSPRGSRSRSTKLAKKCRTLKNKTAGLHLPFVFIQLCRKSAPIKRLPLYLQARRYCKQQHPLLHRLQHPHLPSRAR